MSGKIIQILTMHRATDTETALKNPYEMIGSRKDITASIDVMSLENLVIMRPIGFESKNRIFALKTFSLITLCILVALESTIKEIITALIMLAMR